MKNSFLFFIPLLLILLFACQDKQSGLFDDEVPLSSLPPSISTYVSSNYPAANMVFAEKDDDEYEVYLDNCLVLVFDLTGNFLYKETGDDDDDDCCSYLSPDSLPQSAINYLQTNYPSDSVLAVEVDDDDYEVYLSNCEEVTFDLSGNFIEAESGDCEYIAAGDLPASVLNYISANYPNQVIIAAEYDDDEYEVYLDDCTELEFDENGQFEDADFKGNCQCSWSGGGSGNNDDCCPYISPDSLSQSILNYVQTNYPADSILAVEVDDDDYEVQLSNCEELTFDQNGNFIEAETEDCDYVAPADLPSAILNYVSANHPNQTIIAAEFDDDGDDDEYEVFLDDCTVLEFDENGQFEESEDATGDC